MLLQIYFDKENGLKKAEEWIPFLNKFDSGVKILVCEQCSIDEHSKQTFKMSGMAQSYSKQIFEINMIFNLSSAQQWCIRHGYELVELDPLEKPDPDDDFPETLGIERIIQALHAHSWPNLELKSKSNFYCYRDQTNFRTNNYI